MESLGPLKGENLPRESNYVISWLRFAEEASVILDDRGRATDEVEGETGRERVREREGGEEVREPPVNSFSLASYLPRCSLWDKPDENNAHLTLS